MGAKISWVTVVRVPAARPDGARRPRPELAAVVHLVTDGQTTAACERSCGPGASPMPKGNSARLADICGGRAARRIRGPWIRRQWLRWYWPGWQPRHRCPMTGVPADTAAGCGQVAAAAACPALCGHAHVGARRAGLPLVRYVQRHCVGVGARRPTPLCARSCWRNGRRACWPRSPPPRAASVTRAGRGHPGDQRHGARAGNSRTGTTGDLVYDTGSPLRWADRRGARAGGAAGVRRPWMHLRRPQRRDGGDVRRWAFRL